MNTRIKIYPNFKKKYYAYPVLMIFTFAIACIFSSKLRDIGVGPFVYFLVTLSVIFICILILKKQRQFLREVKCYDCRGETTLFEGKIVGEKFYSLCDKCKIQWDLGLVYQHKSTDQEDFYD